MVDLIDLHWILSLKLQRLKFVWWWMRWSKIMNIPRKFLAPFSCLDTIISIFNLVIQYWPTCLFYLLECILNWMPWILFQNTNIPFLEVGPQTYVIKANEKLICGPLPQIVIPPGSYCKIKDPCRWVQYSLQSLVQTKIKMFVQLSSFKPFTWKLKHSFLGNMLKANNLTWNMEILQFDFMV